MPRIKLTSVPKKPWPLLVVALVGIATATFLAWPNNKTRPEDLSGAVFLDPSKPVEERIVDLIGRMTLAEKAGQMALVERNSVYDKSDVSAYGIGAILSGGGGNPNPNTPTGWLDMVNGFQTEAGKSRLGIPLLYGVDGVHGHANLPGATVFPHFIGLGASRDPDLVRRVAQATADEMAATGVYWNFSPNLDVASDPRWGRMYESFGSDTASVTKLGRAYQEGIVDPSIGTAKHYVGAGAMVWGTSVNKDYGIDQGDARINEATLRKTHLPPFKVVVEAGVASVMVGLNGWNGARLTSNKYLLTDVLKDELGFGGFVVSDWYGVYAIPGGEYRSVVAAVNAGVDMVMLPFDYKSFTRYVENAVVNGDIPEARINDAVHRILRAKFRAGLFENPLVDQSRIDLVGSSEHRELAREAVRASLVLLKDNNKILPLDKTAGRVIVAGSSAHNLGRQCGGWTVEWQGIDGNWIPGVTILDAIKGTVSTGTQVEYALDGTFASSEQLADVGIAVVGEKPYAEGVGDEARPRLTPEDLATIAKVKAASKKLVVVIVSGRPLDIRPYASNWDAIVAAWLPGSEGQGVSDVLFGDYPFKGKLPVAWSF